MTDYIQVATTTERKEDAETIARRLVEERLAACVQIVGPITSVYRWKGKIEMSQEYRCEMKTTTNHYVELAAMIVEQHSYEVPEIVTLPIAEIDREYAGWMDGQLGEV